jgi:3-oxoacyl-[acyl-carrier-protein] synthase III
MMKKTDILQKFVNVYFDLLDIMKLHSNGNTKFNTFYNKNKMLRKANMKLFIKIWEKHIQAKYKHHILAENIDYFMNHDFANERNQSVAKTYEIDNCLHYMRQMYFRVEKNVLQSFVDHMKALVLLCDMYNDNVH